jgi:hypothetical protein|nr:MAG TPA: Receptor Binding Protein [Caudoviricetes sp.]
MSVTSGFFDSVNGDRKYNAQQMSSIFDGIVTDGVFQNIGRAFFVQSVGGNDITVEIGRAWFNHCWLLNDSILRMTIPDSNVLLERIDAVVIEINHEQSVRAGMIKVVQGEPSRTPQRPIMVKSRLVNQYPLCYIFRSPNTQSFTQSHITNSVGTSECPYITGILQTQNIDNVVAQWSSQFKDWNNQKKRDFISWFDQIKNLLNNSDATRLGRVIDRSNNVIDVWMVVNRFTQTAPYTLRIDIPDMKATDIPEISHHIIDGVTDPAIIRGAWKSYSCIDKIKTFDGYMDIICLRKKPTQDISLFVKGVWNG